MKYITITRKRERERLCTDVLQVSINSLNSTKVLAHVHLCNTLVEQNLLKKNSFRTQSPTDPTPLGPQAQPQRCKSAAPTEPQNFVSHTVAVDPLWSCFVCLLPAPLPQSHPRLEPITPANAAKKSPEMVVNLDDSSCAWLNAYTVGIRHSSDVQDVFGGPKLNGGDCLA